MSKVLLGITTYGPIPRAQRLVQTILETTTDGVPYSIAIADDSLGGNFDNTDRRKFCRDHQIVLLESDVISGIPASWNRLVRYGKENGAEIIVILSDGVRFLVLGWLSRMVYFLENNEKIGTVGTPTVGEPTFDPNEPRWNGMPGRVGCAVGCSFAFKTEVHDLVKNEDGTTGFWEDLISFHEEIDFGFSLAEQGYLSAMLPWPPSYYRGGMAFAAHDELIWRTPSPYMPMDTFLKYARMDKNYVKQFEERYEKGEADKMSFSRVQFSKKWGILDEVDAGRRYQEIKGETVDILSSPQKFVHPRVVDIWPPRTVQWLNREGKVERREDF